MKVGCRTGNRPEGQRTVQIGRNATLPTWVAVDVSPVMLDRRRTKVAVQHLRSVEVIQAGFFTYGRAGDSAGVVLRGRNSRQLPSGGRGTRTSALPAPSSTGRGSGHVETRARCSSGNGRPCPSTSDRPTCSKPLAV
jgi:hypothetical protein